MGKQARRKKNFKKEDEKITLKNLIRRIRSFFFEGVGGVCVIYFQLDLDNIKIAGKFLVLKKGKPPLHFSAESPVSAHSM